MEYLRRLDDDVVALLALVDTEASSKSCRYLLC